MQINLIKAFVLIFILNQAVKASFTDISIGGGLFNRYVGKIQTERAGDTNTWNYRVHIELDTTYSLSPDWHLIPEAGLLWPGESKDDAITKFSYFFNGHIGYFLSEKLLLRAGPGLFITFLKGEGGTTELPNGTGTTSFFVPASSTNTSNVVFTFAPQYFFSKNFSSKIETMLFNAINSRNRAFSYSISFRYHFMDSLWKD